MMTDDGFNMDDLFDRDEDFVALVEDYLGKDNRFFIECAKSQLGDEWKKIGVEILKQHSSHRLQEFLKL